MGKYSPETLRGMAQIVIQDRQSGGRNSFALLMELSARFNTAPETIMSWILRYAN